jgi:hypothetical protein
MTCSLLTEGYFFVLNDPARQVTAAGVEVNNALDLGNNLSPKKKPRLVAHEQVYIHVVTTTS